MFKLKTPAKNPKKDTSRGRFNSDTRWLYSLTSEKRNMDLLNAVRNGDIKEVKELLEKGADPNARVSLQRPPLMAAVSRGNRDIVELLLENGADVNLSVNDKTALTLARKNKDEKMVSLLKKYRSEKNA